VLHTILKLSPLAFCLLSLIIYSGVLSMSHFKLVVSSTVMLALTGCANLPSGPAVLVLPGSGMSFDRFINDNTSCQQLALAQAANLVGTASGSMDINQLRYDAAFIQCMYAKGHQVPVSGQLALPQAQVAPAAAMPPPPPGLPPAPPTQ
jgi:hypothetical protein